MPLSPRLPAAAAQGAAPADWACRAMWGEWALSWGAGGREGGRMSRHQLCALVSAWDLVSAGGEGCFAFCFLFLGEIHVT